MKLLRNALLITMDHTRRVISDGAVAVEGNRIIAVGKSRELVKTYPMADVVECHGKLVLPGFVNAHNHLYQSLMRGLSDDGEGRGRPGRYNSKPSTSPTPLISRGRRTSLRKWTGLARQPFTAS